MREALVKSDLIECVLGLGPGLFYNSPMEAVVITLRSKKPVAQRGKVLLINAVDQVSREQAQSFLRKEHRDKILDAYNAFENIDGFAAVATQDQIEAEGHSLAIPLYVAGAKAADTGGKLGVVDALSIWRSAGEEAEMTIENVLDMLRKEVSA